MDVIFEESIFPFQNHTPLKSNPNYYGPSLVQPMQSFATPLSAQIALSPSPNLQSPTPLPILDTTQLPPPESSSSPIPVSSSSTQCHQLSSTHPTPPQNVHPMLTRAKNNVSKPKVFKDGSSHHPIAHALTATSDLTITEPTCFSQASMDPNWRQAMNSEFDALLKNNTSRLVPTSTAKYLVGCKGVFRIKRKVDGSIDCYKAWLVAKGFHQQAGIDYSKTYSSITKPTTIRLVLSIVLSSEWSIKQIDIQNAFLHGFLTEEV